MATLTGSAAIALNAHKQLSGDLGVRYGTYSMSGALSGDDVVQLVQVFKGETVVGVILKVTDLDTDGTPQITLDIGYGGAAAATVNAFANASDIGQAGGTANAFVPVAFTADDTIDVRVDTAPATGATTGTLQMWLLVA